MNSLNYIGSKTSMYTHLYPHFSKLIETFDRQVIFGDLFSGTGCIGYNIGTTFNAKIIANDIQYYSFVINKANLSRYSEEDIKNINVCVAKYNALKGVEGFIYTNYSQNEECERMYFTNDNAKKIDAIRIQLEIDKEGVPLQDNVYYYLLANLISSADKVANTSCVYGAYLKDFKSGASKPLKMTNNIDEKHLQQVTVQGDVYCENISDLVCLPQDMHFDKHFDKHFDMHFDIVYLDPPYNQRQYAPNYHILETIAKYDNPEIHGKTGLRDYSNQKSAFCNKSIVLSTMETLIQSLNTKYILISYNDEGLITKEKFSDLLQKYGRLEIVEIKYKKFKAQENVKRSSIVEYLFILEKQ